MRPKLLKRIETNSNPNPISSAVVVTLFRDVVDNTATICTPEMPTKAREQPIIARLVNILLRNILERMAVVTITPPFDICHTELSTVFSAR
jgi:hypothetical protein